MSGEHAATKARGARNWLSSWLCLRRYDGVADLTLYQWGMQFAARARALERWRATSVIGPASLMQLIETPLNFGTRGFRLADRRPIEEIGHLDIRNLTSLVERVPGATAHWDSRYGQHSAETRAINNISGAGFQIQSTLLTAVSQAKSELGTRAPTDLPELKQHLEIGFVGVDFRYSNDTLRAQFGDYLERTRRLLCDAGMETTSPGRATRSAERFTSDTISQWIRLMVLPYIDILLVAEAQEQPMPSNEVIGESLFPDSDKDIEALMKKQVSPRARKLLQPKNYERMLLEGQQIPGPLYVWEISEN